MAEPTPSVFSSSEALRFGWQKTKENLKPLLILGAVAAFLALLSQALSQPGPTGAHSILWIAIQLMQTAVTLAYVRIALRVNDGHTVDLSSPTALLNDYFTFLLTSVLYGLIVAAGFILLVVPGVIWAIAFGFSLFIVVDKKLDPLESLRESRRLTAGFRGQLLGFGVLAMAVNFVGALALGIGLMVTVPTTFIAAAYVFRRLQARLPSAAPIPPPASFTTPAESH